MKKIVLYIDNMNRGGAQRVMGNLAEHFLTKGINVILINDYPPDGTPGKSKPPHLVCICGHADRGTNPSILLCEDMGRAKIPALQPDRSNSSHASLFYDV